MWAAAPKNMLPILLLDIPAMNVKVLIPWLRSDSGPKQRRGSSLRWLLLARSELVPAGCVCHWADWRWSPLRGSSEQGLHHPACPGDPPFETGRTGGIEGFESGRKEKRDRAA